jgi:cobalt-zinc-cadmium efflux system outer membrane protein
VHPDVRIVSCAIAFLAAAGWAAAPAAEIPSDPAFGTTLALDELIAAVLQRNPGLAASRAALEAARQEAARARELEDPTASAMLAPQSLGGAAPFGWDVRAGQRIPYPGKLRLRGEAARDEATAAEEQLAAMRLALAERAAGLYADYYLVARELEINVEHLALLRTFQRVAAARYGAGLVPQQAPLQAEVEAALMLQQGVELAASRRRLVAQLDALLHRPAEAPLPPPPAALAPAPGTGSDGASERDAVMARPELRAARAKVAARQAELELARRARQPDLELMGGYNSMWGTREHRWTVGVGVNLPLRRRRIRDEVAAAQARLDQATAELAGLEDTLLAEAATAAVDRDESLRLLDLYRDRLIPAARDQVAAARASFESGGEPMLALIEAERSLRDAQRRYHEAVAGSLRAQAALARARGEMPGPPQPLPAGDLPPGEK